MPCLPWPFACPFRPFLSCCRSTTHLCIKMIMVARVAAGRGGRLGRQGLPARWWCPLRSARGGPVAAGWLAPYGRACAGPGRAARPRPDCSLRAPVRAAVMRVVARQRGAARSCARRRGGSPEPATRCRACYRRPLGCCLLSAVGRLLSAALSSDGRTDGQTDGQTGGRTDRPLHF